MERVAINPMDAAWLYVEKEQAPAHFGPLIFMSCPVGDEGFVQRLVAEWRKSLTFAPPFNYHLAKGLVPRWAITPNEQLDMEYHLRHSALPAPGGEAELGIMVSRLHSHKLDRKKPLWQCYVIEGIGGGRFAIYLKLHHAQLDGMAASALLGKCFSPDPDARNMPAPWTVGLTVSPEKKAAAKLKKESSAAQISAWSRLSNIRRALSTLGKEAYLNSKSSLFAPYQGPKSVLNGRISGHRRYATQRFELAQLKRIADKAGVKINDVFLTVTGAALRRYLLEQDALPKKSLVGQIPVSIRPAGDDAIGNALSFVYATLGTDLDDPLARLLAVSQSTASAKSLQSTLTVEAIEAYTSIVLAPYITETILGLGGYMRPASNLVISNVIGPRQRMYLNGARIEHIYGPSVLFHGQALNITMSSYADEINIGYTACRDSLPSMQRIAVYSGEAMNELEVALGL